MTSERAARDVLAEVIGAVELGFWRETPIEDPDGVHGIEARFDVRAFAEAITAALAARGYALVRTLETQVGLKWFGEPRYSVSDLQRAYAEGFAAATPSPTPPEGLRRAAQWLVDIHADDVSIPRGSALWEDLQSLKAALLAASPAPDPGAGPDTLRRAVVAAASIFLAAHDRVVASDVVTRDDTFAMKNAADNLCDVLREYALDPLPQWPDGPVPTAVQNAWNEAHLAAEDAAPSAEPPETP